MIISKIGQSISESVTLKLNQTFATLKKQGEPVIHLGGGEPKSKAPVETIKAVENLLETREVRYAPVDGTIEAKQAVINYTEKHYGLKFENDNIVVSGGAKQSLMVALQTVVNPGDEVIFPVPFWVSYPDMIKLCGGNPIQVMPRNLSKSFEPNIDDIKNKINGKTKAIIINSPNNPSGEVYSEDFIRKIVEISEANNIYIIMDDIYHQLIFDGIKKSNPYDFIKTDIENSKIIIINGVSKAYAMTGFRIGWGIANKKVSRVMANIQGHQTSGPSVLCQLAATAAINGNQSPILELRSNLEKHRNLLIDKIKEIPNLKINKPKGTFYSFIDFSYYEKNSTKLSAFLLEKVKVLTMPGVEFGIDGFLRLSFCGSEKDIIEGIERIKWALDKNSPKEITIGNLTLKKD